MNTPVNFEIAKLLKEKGFDIPCTDYYTSRGLLNSNGWGDIIYEDGGFSSGEPERMIRFDYSDFSKRQKEEYYLCPTISEVVMWLYEKHKIWISVGGDCDYKFRFEIHKWNWYELEKTYRLGHIMLGESLWDTTSNHFNSPKEAYEAAIEYTLNSLI